VNAVHPLIGGISPAVNSLDMFRRTILPLSLNLPFLRRSLLPQPLIRPFSSSLPHRIDPFPSVLEDVTSPLEITSVLRTGNGFKIRTLQEPEPRTIHGNVIVLDGEYFIWRPELSSPQPGVLDIAPDAWGVFEVITPKPGSPPHQQPELT
jgi:hypothetical protein